MARVTVEDCIEKVPSRFELVLYAAHRARQIVQGATLTIVRDRDRNPVVALREIAEGTILPETLQEELIGGLRRVSPAAEQASGTGTTRRAAQEARLHVRDEDEMLRIVRAAAEEDEIKDEIKDETTDSNEADAATTA